MKMSPAFRRPAVAVASAAAVVAMLAGCSNSDDDAKTDASTSASTSAVAQALDNAQAQEILRTALNEKTPEADLKKVVDDSNPATITTLVAYNKVAAKAGYTPDIYTVKSVKVDGDKADATVAVASPHMPGKAVDMQFSYVKSGDAWKLSAASVDALNGQMKGHGGGK